MFVFNYSQNLIFTINNSLMEYEIESNKLQMMLLPGTLQWGGTKTSDARKHQLSALM